MNDIIEREESIRMAFWTKAYAVGDEDWLEDKLTQAGIKRMKIKNENKISFAIGEMPKNS